MSSHRPEATAFLDRLAQAKPGKSLDNVLQPSIDEEAELRRLWASEKTHAKLQDPYVGLVDVFAAPEATRQTRAREINVEDDTARDGKYIMPLADDKRRKTGDLSMSKDMDEFLANFKIFTGELSYATYEPLLRKLTMSHRGQLIPTRLVQRHSSWWVCSCLSTPSPRQGQGVEASLTQVVPYDRIPYIRRRSVPLGSYT
jgi:hypothetical protein